MIVNNYEESVLFYYTRTGKSFTTPSPELAFARADDPEEVLFDRFYSTT
jgi:hypothetical protein